MAKKMVKVKSHGSAYYKKDKTLMVCPLYRDNTIDTETCAMVEESPKSFRRGHRIALRKMKVKKKDIPKYLKKIEYY